MYKPFVFYNLCAWFTNIFLSVLGSQDDDPHFAARIRPWIISIWSKLTLHCRGWRRAPWRRNFPGWVGKLNNYRRRMENGGRCIVGWGGKWNANRRRWLCFSATGQPRVDWQPPWKQSGFWDLGSGIWELVRTKLEGENHEGRRAQTAANSKQNQTQTENHATLDQTLDHHYKKSIERVGNPKWPSRLDLCPAGKSNCEWKLSTDRRQKISGKFTRIEPECCLKRNKM